MTSNSIAEDWNLRLATLATVGSASAYLLLGAGIVQSDKPAIAACIVAGGMEALAYCAMLGGLGLIAGWGLAVTPRDRKIFWQANRKIWRLPVIRIKTKHVRSVLLMFATIGTFTALIMILSTMAAGAHVGGQVAAGRCIPVGNSISSGNGAELPNAKLSL